MTITLFSVAILAIFAVCAVIEIYRGARRGFLKSLVTLCSAVASIILSVCLSPALSYFIADTVIYNIKHTPFYRSLVGSFSSMEILVEALAGAAISTVLFVLVFCLVRFVVAIVVHLVYRSKLKSDPSKPQYMARDGSFIERNSVRLGMITGAVCAVVVTMALTSPVMGTLDVARSVIKIGETADAKIWQSSGVETEIDAVKKYSADLPGNLFYRFGGKLMYRASATASVEGERVYVLDEMELFHDTVKNFNQIYPMLKDPSKVSEKRIDAIERLCENVEDMKLCHVLIADFLPVGANAWLEGKRVFKISKPVLNELIMPAFDEMLRVCARTDLDNVKQNTVTLLRVYSIILTSGILDMENGSYSEMIKHLEKTNAISLLCAELNKNPYMQSVNRSVGEMAVRVLAKELVKKSTDDLKYDNFVKNMASAITSVKSRDYGTTEEMVDVLTDYTLRYTSDLGVSVPQDVAGFASESLLKEVVSVDEYVTISEIKKIILDYSKQ